MFIKLTNSKDNNINNKQGKRISPSVTALIGTIIIMVGGFFLFYSYVNTKKVMVYDYMNNIFYVQGSTVEPSEENLITNSEVPNASYDVEQYVGYLNIPKINLNKGFYPKDSPYNDVEKNLLVVKESHYPNEALGNLIIAAHSGTGWKAFFNDLYKLSIGDIAVVDFQGKKYTYKFVNIYKADKTGTISIYRNKNKTSLTLVTCTNNDSTTQTIYIGELQSVE